MTPAGRSTAAWTTSATPPLTQINRDNVAKLQVAWTYDSHDAFNGSEMQSNPIVVDGVLYATTPTLKVVAVNAANRTRDLEVRSERRRRAGRAVPPSRRHRPQGSRVRQLSQLPLGARQEDRHSRSPSFGADGRIDLREGLDQPAERLSVSASTPGVVFEDLLIMGSSVPGDAARLARPHPRLRREHRQAALDLPHHSEAGRVRLRHLAEGRLQAVGRRERVGRRHRRREARDGVRRHRFGVVRFLRRHPARRQPVRRLRARARRAHRHAASGTSRASSTTSGTATSRRRQTSSPSRATAARWTRWRRSPSTATSTCSIGAPARRCFRSSCARFRRRRSTASGCPNGSRIRSSRRRSRGRA